MLFVDFQKSLDDYQTLLSVDMYLSSPELFEESMELVVVHKEKDPPPWRDGETYAYICDNPQITDLNLRCLLARFKRRPIVPEWRLKNQISPYFLGREDYMVDRHYYEMVEHYVEIVYLTLSGDRQLISIIPAMNYSICSVLLGDRLVDIRDLYMIPGVYAGELYRDWSVPWFLQKV